jgi:hypothetical protein
MTLHKSDFFGKLKFSLLWGPRSWQHSFIHSFIFRRSFTSSFAYLAQLNREIILSPKRSLGDIFIVNLTPNDGESIWIQLSQMWCTIIWSPESDLWTESRGSTATSRQLLTVAQLVRRLVNYLLFLIDVSIVVYRSVILGFRCFFFFWVL